MEVEAYEVIRKRVEQRFQQRSSLYSHIVVYAVVNILLWIIYGVMTQLGGQYVPIIGTFVPIAFFPWPLIVMGGWGIGLVAHGLNYYIRYGGGAMRREAAIRREIEREMARSMAYEKPKNDVPMRLTDDGELEAIEDDPHWPMKRKHQ